MRDDGKPLLQAVDDGKPWSMAIMEESGKITMNASGDREGFIAFRDIMVNLSHDT